MEKEELKKETTCQSDNCDCNCEENECTCEENDCTCDCNCNEDMTCKDGVCEVKPKKEKKNDDEIEEIKVKGVNC